MGNPYFQFKQFTVWHDRCAMKVGTDGVLLGAWSDLSGAGRILDVGCGTGLVALMAAQRTPCEVYIDGVEISPEAAEQAGENTARSPWAQRIAIHAVDFLDFVRTTHARYTHILSNPPYFEHSLLPPDAARLTARHTDSLSYDTLLQGAAALLAPEGRVSLIFPADLRATVVATALRCGLYPHRLLWVSGRVDTPPKRVLIEWGTTPAHCSEEYLAIESAPLQWTPEYRALTRDFYLRQR